MELDDPHTKVYLLLQGWLGRCKMPVSDYVNDTKSVVEQMGRMLAAMAFVTEGGGQKDGMLDVMVCIIGARQCLAQRCYGDGEDALCACVDEKCYEVSERSERALRKTRNTRDESREMATDGKFQH